ncbi:MAG: pimeloyl-ACP methyl ester carboxylesterase [Paraglaciecola psychrophila]|jgi:pimeloyl-ACP methyl ester carboxylesterase
MTRKTLHTPPDMEGPADRLSVDSADDPNYVGEAPSSTIITRAPKWFKDALEVPSEECRVEVDGCSLCYTRWGDPSKPGVIFVHGNGAHGGWFNFLAPLLSQDFHVVSMHLAGMGDSGWRKSYSREQFGDDVLAVCEHAELGPKPVIVGHSFGGFVSLMAGHRHPDKFGGIVLVDYSVKTKENHEEWFLNRPEPRPTRVYASYEDARARFRLAPPQPCANQYILDYIGHQSLRQTDDGWTWKFDPAIYYKFRIGDDLEQIYRNLPLPVVAIMGEHSWSSSPEVMEPMRAMRPATPLFFIPDANHHILLDQPIAFVATLKGLFTLWPERS